MPAGSSSGLNLTLSTRRCRLQQKLEECGGRGGGVGGGDLQNNLVVEGDEKILALMRLQHQAAFQRGAATELIYVAR